MRSIPGCGSQTRFEESSYWRGVAYSVLGQSLHWRGKTTDAVAALEDAVPLARTGGHAHTEASSLGHLAAVHAERGDLSLAGELADQAVSLGEGAGGAEHWAGGMPLIVRGQAHARSGARPAGWRSRARSRASSPAYSTRPSAAAQHVSRNTVKTQSRSLCRKLDVTSRAQAVDRARELHLW
ncbi:MAG: hypothetical protein ACRDYX_12210 [Egibacteraceae bacterium]